MSLKNHLPGVVVEQMDWVLNSVLAGVGGFVFVLLVLCLWCRQRRHPRRLPTSPGTQRQHVCDELGQRFASVDSV